MSERETTTASASVDPELLTPGLVHELRQPLMAIDAAGALLERALGDALEGHPDWAMLKTQVARVAEILRGYEELIRPGESEPRAFAVQPVVARAVDLLAHRLRPLERRFAFRREAGGPQGFGAPGAVIHATTNLLANAVDALEGAATGARIEVRVLAVPRGVEVRVSDEGCGIDASARERLFEPRFTTKPPGKGTGLGLHIARRLMNHFGGTVDLVAAGDPARLPWAVTEFRVAMPVPREVDG